MRRDGIQNTRVGLAIYIVVKRIDSVVRYPAFKVQLQCLMAMKSGGKVFKLFVPWFHNW